VIKGISPAFERYGEAVAQGARFVLSLVVHYQMTRYLRLTGASRLLRKYTDLIANWTLVGLDREDWDTAIDLWVARHRAGRPIEDADLLIAVTALKAGAILVTNNVSHFDGLGLMAENWALPAQE
jgi:tRNA(fMet)-specific endonuclease VapC